MFANYKNNFINIRKPIKPLWSIWSKWNRALICLAQFFLVCATPIAIAENRSSDTYLGPKKTVFVDVVAAVEAMYGGNKLVGTTNEGLNAMLVDTLIRSGGFVVVERVALDTIQLEQDLGKGGATTAETAAVSGRMLGASAIVRATVTKFDPAAGGSELQIGIPFSKLLGGSAGVSGQQAIVEFSLRIIDTSTGQVIFTSKAAGTASSSSANVSATNNATGANLGASTFKSTPLGEAAEIAINAAVKQIVQAMAKVPWSTTVAAFDEGKVYLSAGAAQNLKAGTTLHVYRKGKALTDPDTGALLEVLMTSVGTIQIQSVNEKISTASVSSGDKPARGDVVRFE
jgi:curli biogenesis system outer membrane secretion channel CsgG